MKRASEVGLKHQILLHDYLELQKEFVSKKKKLLAIKQKRDSLLAEVGFLKQKHKYLLKVRSPEIKLGNSANSGRKINTQIELGNYVNSDRKRKMLGMEIAERTNEPALRIQYPILASDSNLIEEKKRGRGIQEVSKELGIKKNKVCLIDNKDVGKKKISWQDPMTLKVVPYDLYCASCTYHE